MSELKIDLRDVEGVTVVKLSGEASVATSDVMERGLMGLYARRPAAVVLDLSELSFISSLGMGHLMTMRQHVVERRGGTLRAAALQGPVLTAFQRSGLDKMVPVYDDLDAALAA
jgi:anti-anti-sigma factor